MKPAALLLNMFLLVGLSATATANTNTHEDAEATLNKIQANFGGIWMPTVYSPDGSRTQRYPDSMPYLPAVQQGLENYRANYNAEVDDASRSCLPYGMPRQMLGRAQYPFEFIFTEDRLTILTELHNDIRRIYLDGRLTPQGLLPTWMGYSTGEWQGDTLIITTTNLRESDYPNPQSTQVILTERYALVSSNDMGTMLALELTIDDPKVFSKPISVRNHFRRYPEVEMGEYFCTEDLWRQNIDNRSDAIPWR